MTSSLFSQKCQYLQNQKRYSVNKNAILLCSERPFKWASINFYFIGTARYDCWRGCREINLMWFLEFQIPFREKLMPSPVRKVAWFHCPSGQSKFFPACWILGADPENEVAKALGRCEILGVLWFIRRTCLQYIPWYFAVKYSFLSSSRVEYGGRDAGIQQRSTTASSCRCQFGLCWRIKKSKGGSDVIGIV